MDLPEAESMAIDIAKGAGSLIKLGVNEPKSLAIKSSEVDLLTQFDREADAYITKRLADNFPGHRIISEESSSDVLGEDEIKSGYVWHVDPLDGTINFAHGYPVFAVSLALYFDDRPRLAVICDPLRDECFSAKVGQGAKLRTGEHERAIQVSTADNLLECLLATGYAYDRHRNRDDNLIETAAFLKRARGLRRSGSAALDLAYVAAGRLDGYWEFGLNSWDVAAGALLVTEAGGVVSGMDSRELQMHSQVSLVASNGLIHRSMLGVLDAVATESFRDS
jgi:myo-inositol-1(or 4)-monophosphatase